MDEFLAIVKIFAGNFAPRGWAICAGQILPIAQNTALFSLLGTTYGGNGQTTFALPDLRGRAPIGAGQGPGLTNISLGEVSGTETVTMTINQMPAHNHPIAIPAVSGTGDLASPENARPADIAAGGYSTAAANTTMAPGTSGLAGSSQPVPIRNPYLGINYIICLEGIFPSRN